MRTFLLDDYLVQDFVRTSQLQIDRWNTWHIPTSLEPPINSYQTEVQFSKNEKTFLSGISHRKYICYKAEDSNGLNLAIRYNSRDDCPSLTSILKIARRITLDQHPLVDITVLTRACLDIMFGKTTSNSLGEYSDFLSSISVNHQGELKKVAVVVANKYRLEEQGLPMYLKVGEVSYPLPATAYGLPVHLAKLVIAEPEEAKREIGLSLDGAALLIWDELLFWQPLFFGRTSKSVSNLLDALQGDLVSKISRGEDRPKNLERYAFIEALKYPTTKVSFRMTFPNLVFYRNDGKPENEYDSVSIILRSNKDSELWIWAVTDVADQRKIDDDIAKAQHLKDTIYKRWGGQVRAVVNYVRREGDHLIAEVDGVQKRIRLGG